MFLRVVYKPEMLDEADESIHCIIDSRDDKAWGKILPQPVEPLNKMGPWVESYLSDWIGRWGYTPNQITAPRLCKLWVKIWLLPFVTLRKLIATFWARKYPGFPFLMQKYPAARNYATWLGRVFGW